MFIAKTISGITCQRCNRPVREFYVPDAVWNAVIRGNGPRLRDEELCVWCFVKAASAYILTHLPASQDSHLAEHLKDGNP